MNNMEEGKASTKLSEVLPALPKENRWEASADLYQYQGFWYPLGILEPIISAKQNFKSTPNDIYICSCPKTGCTWLKALSYGVITRDRFELENNNPLITNLSHLLIPFLEGDFSGTSINKCDPEVPLIATHLCFDALPESIKSFKNGTKIIYICRDPKDTFISLWHFTLTLQRVQFVTSLEKELELFCEGKSLYGPYWDHVLGYWQASLENPESVLFLKYEELIQDTSFYVRKMADFMGKPFSRDEEGQGVPEKIVKLCSFDNMSNMEVNKRGKHQQFQIDNSAFFRKGKPGDWRNHLTPNMIKRMDHVTQEKLRGTTLSFGASSTTNP